MMTVSKKQTRPRNIKLLAAMIVGFRFFLFFKLPKKTLRKSSSVQKSNGRDAQAKIIFE
jgi:hypothetical protein